LAVAAPILTKGYLGVDLFFILSGFVLAYNYIDPGKSWTLKRYLQFQGLRLGRIYPLHVLTIVLIVCGLLMASVVHVHVNRPEGFGWQSLATNLMLVHGWTLVPVPGSWNYASWSISAEWFAYLAFPALALGIRRLTSARLLVLMAVATACAGTAVQVAMASGPGPLIRVVPDFTLGAILGRLYLSVGRPSTAWGCLAALAGIGVIAGFVVLERLHLSPQLVVPLFGLLVFGLASGQGYAVNWLKSPFLLASGEASYALYMMHGVIAMFASRILPLESFAAAPITVRTAVIAVYCAVFAIVAGLTHRWIERPARDRVRSAIMMRRRSPHQV
jgi:peptidoglycan/LPS O-acetylase OafA/YrhL